MLEFIPNQTLPQKIQEILLHGVSPRPIAFVSTQSAEGINNLSPFHSSTLLVQILQLWFFLLRGAVETELLRIHIIIF